MRIDQLQDTVDYQFGVIREYEQTIARLRAEVARYRILTSGLEASIVRLRANQRVIIDLTDDSDSEASVPETVDLTNETSDDDISDGDSDYSYDLMSDDDLVSLLPSQYDT